MMVLCSEGRRRLSGVVGEVVGGAAPTTLTRFSTATLHSTIRKLKIP
jgi:hypothetical protein